VTGRAEHDRGVARNDFRIHAETLWQCPAMDRERQGDFWASYENGWKRLDNIDNKKIEEAG
jgi:hypothetical protein